ncbi:MAG: SAM-dependent methyltransferase [Bacteroidales bacterium]|nr:SAM-dependent methyltransferase [Bacteroidales bacterium]
MEKVRGTNRKTGKLFLIPTTLGETEALNKVLPGYNLQVIHSLDVFIVEQLRTARRFLKKAKHPRPIDEMQFFELNKFTDIQSVSAFLLPARDGQSVGLLSEAGTPCIADPGAAIVSLAHKNGIQVVPLVGPNSILLALMASGFNGQQFCFHGYLPVDSTQLNRKIREIEANSRKLDQSQIFIETPYRNKKLFDSLLRNCKPQPQLCVATDLSLASEKIATATVDAWKKKTPDFHKKPTVFLLYSV